MTENKSPAEVATFDTLLADPGDREKMLARQNQLAQEELNRKLGMVPPRLPPQKRNRNGHPR
jgi:hypothetical protein